MIALDRRRAQVAATVTARRLARPQTSVAGDTRCGLPQSLADGAAGVALLHIERARAGLAGWDTAHAWLAAAVRDDISAGPNAGLFFGAPAVAFALHAAAVRRPESYTRALATLDASVAAVTRRRLDRAHARIDRGERPALAEFDLISGLTGLGAYLLRCDPRCALTRGVLSYLVRLTEPLHHDGERLPGWWTDLAPSGRKSADYPGGHGNLGVAHGIGGPLALLSLAMRRGVVVHGQADAIGRICAWLDAWRQDQEARPWWPQWVTPEEVHHHRPTQSAPSRPSWCYGTPGLARAQQLAGLATDDIARQRTAETALIGCLTDPVQLTRITDSGLCHGNAGVYHTAWRVAIDAHTPDLRTHLRCLSDRLLEHRPPDRQAGLLEGDAGLALALHTAATTDTGPALYWDACLLLN